MKQVAGRRHGNSLQPTPRAGAPSPLGTSGADEFGTVGGLNWLQESIVTDILPTLSMRVMSKLIGHY